MKGIIVVYLNFHPEHSQNIEATMDIVRRINAPLLNSIQANSDYVVMLVPTTKEACRIEKIDFEMPFPRFFPMKLPTSKRPNRERHRAIDSGSKSATPGTDRS